MEDTNTYIATHYREDPDTGRVAQLRLLVRDASGEFEDRKLVERAEIIELLKDDKLIFVWDYEAENIGEMIELIGISGEIYLRLDEERLCADNLGDLPSV
ncbi:hypothetical protein [Bradymonas sediminis]|uniref:Uncharacterized protein n=1 Tax=Bradymonas sediminis TaxID=1548548 RepID=A0A2Z4FHL6_9DELT|nr:hypothetical protein [Bradymonas sediminis]AWV88156.1 hypothetical protein DN745_01915 [Bradymonas sediminis]TDP77279.1 hypothetical protein DFR33_101179 [Bradymonas sediminis]